MHPPLAIALLAALLCAPAVAQVKVEAAWARPTVQGQTVGGAYLTLQSAQADRLLGASTPVAGSVELHRMSMDGDVMRMRSLDAIDLPAGRSVALKPGGTHLMLVGLKAPLKAGEKFPLKLRFEKAGEVEVVVNVEGAAAGATAPMHAASH